MPKLLRIMIAVAVRAVFAGALISNTVSALTPDEELREVFLEASRAAASDEMLRRWGAARPTLGYQVAIELCESALIGRSKGEDAETDFKRAERIARALRSDRGGAALLKLVTLYRGYDRLAAESWLGAKTLLQQASELTDAGRLERGLALALAVSQTAVDLGDPIMVAESQRIAGIVARNRTRLDDALKLTASALSLYRGIDHAWGMGRASGNLGRIHRQLGNYEHALDFASDARLYADLAGDPETLAGEWEASGLVYNRLGRYRLALEHLSRAMQTYPASAYAPIAKAAILQNTGLVYENLGMHREAAAQFQAALDLLGDGEAQDVRRAMVRASLGNIYAKLGDDEKAKLHFVSALSVFMQRGHLGDAAIAEMNLGRLDLNRGELESALARYKAVERIARAGKISQVLAQALLGKVEVALGRGDAEQALAWATDACGERPTVRMRAHCERAKGMAFRLLGDLSAASASYGVAIDALEEVHNALGDLTEIPGEALFGDTRRYYLEAVEIAMQLHATQPSAGHDRYAFRLSELSKSRVFQDQIRRTGLRLQGARDAPFQSLLTQERAAIAHVVKFSRAALLAPFAERAEAELERAQSAARLKKIRAQLREQFPPYRHIDAPESVRIDEIQLVLASEEALVSYSVGSKNSVAFVIRRNSFLAVPLAIGEEEMVSRIMGLRAQLEPPGRPQPPAELAAALRGLDPEQARDLYRKIFAPISGTLAGARRIFVAGDGVLFLLPFGALVGSAYDPVGFRAEQERADGARAPYLAEYGQVPWLGYRYSFRYLPAAGSLVYLRAETRSRATSWNTPLVAFADPKFEDEDSPQAKPGRHRRLPATAQEAHAVAKLLQAPPQDVYTRERATKANVHAARLDEARYVLFATHGFAGADFAGGAEPALLLAHSDTPQPQSSLLTMSEVIGLELRAELTVLSACSTAGQPSRAARYGEGFAGLARSFMYAGSRAVLVTHWSVFDTVARDFVIEFFKNAPKEGADAALTSAMENRNRGLITDESSGRKISLAHPVFWAGYALVGD